MLTIGDIIRLKSGGPEMTVVTNEESGHVWATWFSGKKNEKARFPTAALIVVADEKGDD